MSKLVLKISIVFLDLDYWYESRFNLWRDVLINEAKKGELSSREIFGAISFIAICHSLIEDTLIIMLLGADISGILYLRLVFAFIVVGVGIRILANLSDAFFYRFLGVKVG